MKGSAVIFIVTVVSEEKKTNHRGQRAKRSKAEQTMLPTGTVPVRSGSANASGAAPAGFRIPRSLLVANSTCQGTTRPVTFPVRLSSERRGYRAAELE